MMLYRILCGDYQEWLRKRIRMHVHRYLALIHRFKEGRLRLWCGAVDFVRQQNIGKDRAALKLESLLRGGIDRNTQQVAGQHVAGELHALKATFQSTGHCLAQGSFANSGHAFDQQMAAGKDGNQSETDDIIFAANDGTQRAF